MDGAKDVSMAEARFASWAWVHFVVVRRREEGGGGGDFEVPAGGIDFGVCDVVGRGWAKGAWMFGMEGCFNTCGGGSPVVVAVITGVDAGAGGGGGGAL